MANRWTRIRLKDLEPTVRAMLKQYRISERLPAPANTVLTVYSTISIA